MFPPLHTWLVAFASAVLHSVVFGFRPTVVLCLLVLSGREGSKDLKSSSYLLRLFSSGIVRPLPTQREGNLSEVTQLVKQSRVSTKASLCHRWAVATPDSPVAFLPTSRHPGALWLEACKSMGGHEKQRLGPD